MEGTNWPEVERRFQTNVQQIVRRINNQTISRAVRASNELRNAALTVLRGERSGRVYKKPGTYGGTPSKTTKQLKKGYGHKLRGGQLYRASAPGEPPAVRFGTLRQSWGLFVGGVKQGRRYAVTSAIKTDVRYAPILEKGGPQVAPRPYKDRIIAAARPKIVRIFVQPHT